jgi:hypothetical protein
MSQENVESYAGGLTPGRVGLTRTEILVGSPKCKPVPRSRCDLRGRRAGTAIGRRCVGLMQLGLLCGLLGRLAHLLHSRGDVADPLAESVSSLGSTGNGGGRLLSVNLQPGALGKLEAAASRQRDPENLAAGAPSGFHSDCACDACEKCAPGNQRRLRLLQRGRNDFLRRRTRRGGSLG